MHKDVSALISRRTDGHHHSRGGLTGPEEIVTSEQRRRGLQRVTLASSRSQKEHRELSKTGLARTLKSALMDLAPWIPNLFFRLGTGFPQESELRSETSAAVPHPTKVSLAFYLAQTLGQVKVTRAPTASAQQSKIVISEVPTG